jgi:hypothetical protein
MIYSSKMHSLNHLIRKAHFSPKKYATVSQQLFEEFQFMKISVAIFTRVTKYLKRLGNLCTVFQSVTHRATLA